MTLRWWTVGILFAFGCGRKPPPPATSSTATPPPVETHGSAAAPQVPGKDPASSPQGSAIASSKEETPEPQPLPSGPVLHLRVNGETFPEAYLGWPLIIRAEVASPDDREWKISGGSRSVSSLFQLEVGGGKDWSPEPVIQSPNQMSVGPGRRLLMAWVLSPERTATLAAGDYHLTVRLTGTGGDGTWKGSVSSPDAGVSFLPEPKRVPPPLAAQKEETFIEYVFWTEGLVKAFARLTEARKKSPHRWQLLVLEGHLQASQRKFRESVQAYDQAIVEWKRQNPRVHDPPMDLLVQRECILNLLHDSEKPAGK